MCWSPWGLTPSYSPGRLPLIHTPSPAIDFCIWSDAQHHFVWSLNSGNFLKGKGRLWRDTGTEHLPAVSLKRYRSSLFVTCDSHCARILDWIFAIIIWCRGTDIDQISGFNGRLQLCAFLCYWRARHSRLSFTTKFLLMISDISNVPCSTLVPVDLVNSAVVLPLP